MGSCRCLVILLVATGCVTACTPPSDPPTQDTAARIYAAAEARAEVGALDEAVSLLRQAVLQLPVNADSDHIRHQLILRMAYLQLVASAQYHESAYAQDARTMLTRYADHATLQGTSTQAEAARAQVYELLYEVERQLEPPATDTPNEVTPQAQNVVGNEETVVDLGDSTTARGNVRRINVRASRLATFDDPRVLERLRSPSSDARYAGLLAHPGVSVVHGPRALVRARVIDLAGAAGELKREARQSGTALLTASRPQLRACYEAAYARRAQPQASATFDVTFAAHGAVQDLRLRSGEVVDVRGSACVLKQLRRSSAGLKASGRQTTVRIAMTFIHQSTLHVVEGSGEYVVEGGIRSKDVTAPSQMR